MTDHLTEARACVSSASQAPHAGSAISWLTTTCKQIIAHLEAQNAPQEATSADLTASQPEPGHRDGDEAERAVMAVLRDEGADSEGSWHSWRCFDRDPEPCDCIKRVARAAIAAAEPHIRAKIAAEIEAAADLSGGDDLCYEMGQRQAARIARQEQP